MSKYSSAAGRRPYEIPLLVVAVAAAGFNLRTAITSLPPLFPDLQGPLHLSPATLSLLAATPVICSLVLGVVIAFTTDWLLVSGPLVWVFRVVAGGAPDWRAAAVGGVLTASFVAGFLQGFVLFLSLPLNLGAPFGGLTAVGGACALLLWLWLLHIVALTGYVVTVTASDLLATASGVGVGDWPSVGSGAAAWAEVMPTEATSGSE